MFQPAPLAPDTFDWIQLTSDEWLKGELIALYDGRLEFDSEELENLTFDWDDIRELRTGRVVQVRFKNRTQLTGRLLQNFAHRWTGGVALGSQLVGTSGVSWEIKAVLPISTPPSRAWWRTSRTTRARLRYWRLRRTPTRSALRNHKQRKAKARASEPRTPTWASNSERSSRISVAVPARSPGHTHSTAFAETSFKVCETL